MRKLLGILSLSALSAPFVVLAQDESTTAIAWIFTLINRAVTWTTYIVGGAATIVIIFAAFMFLTSGGDPSKTTSARNLLMYGLIGVAIALLAVPIVSAFMAFIAVTP